MPTGESTQTRPRLGTVGGQRSWRSFGTHPAVPGPLAQAARWERRYVLCLLLMDIMIVSISVVGGLLLRFREPEHVPYLNVTAALLLAPTWIALLAVSRAYDRERVRTGTEQVKALFEGTVRMTALVALAAYATKSDVSRGFFLIALPGGFLALALGRLAARTLLHRARRRGRCLHRVLAVGTVDDIHHLLRELDRRDHHGLQVVGACTFSGEKELAEGVPVLGTPTDAR